jgi:hypothetical protein
MIRIGWHMATIALLTVGSALLLAGSVLDGDTARGMSPLAAGASTGFAALVMGVVAAANRFSPAVLRHPGPALLIAIAALAWWGSAVKDACRDRRARAAGRKPSMWPGSVHPLAGLTSATARMRVPRRRFRDSRDARRHT